MTLKQRLTKLEERASKNQPVVIWVSPGETREMVRQTAKSKDERQSIFVGWSETTSLSNGQPNGV
jgi:uncharacterized protein YvpB